MSEEIQLAKYKEIYEFDEKVEKLVPFSLYKSDIICLYRSRGQTYVVTRQGFMNKVPYKLSELQEHLGL